LLNETLSGTAIAAVVGSTGGAGTLH